MPLEVVLEAFYAPRFLIVSARGAGLWIHSNLAAVSFHPNSQRARLASVHGGHLVAFCVVRTTSCKVVVPRRAEVGFEPTACVEAADEVLETGDCGGHK